MVATLTVCVGAKVLPLTLASPANVAASGLDPVVLKVGQCKRLWASADGGQRPSTRRARSWSIPRDRQHLKASEQTAGISIHDGSSRRNARRFASAGSAVRQAGDHDALVGLNAIPESKWEIVDAGAAGVTRARDDLILEGVCADAVQRGADPKDELIAETVLARFVVVLRALDVRLRERRDAYRAAQGAG